MRVMPNWMLQIPFVAEGGPIMLILYAMSLLGLAVALERAFALRQERTAPSGWMRHVRDTVAQSGLGALGDEAVWPESDVADVLRQVVRSTPDVAGLQSTAIEQAVTRKEAELARGVFLIGLLATLAPLLGLLGTVIGMIETFRMIAGGSIGDPKALAGGIYQALYTTAGGLTVAIPLSIAHRLLKQRARRVADEIAAFSEDLMWLQRRGERHEA